MYNEFKDIILAAIEQLLDKEKTRGLKKNSTLTCSLQLFITEMERYV